MKRQLLVLLLAVCACMSLRAQDTSEAFVSRYDALVKRVGYSGVGVETLLDRWEEAFRVAESREAIKVILVP